MNVAHALLELPDPQTRKLLAASTAEVYGIQESVPLREDFFLHPSSPYAATKAASDMYLQMMFGTFNLHGSVLRPTNSYGRKYDTSFMVEYLITQMLKDEPVFIGAPDSVRDYMYIDDHVNAYLLALKDSKADGKTYNAGTGVGVTNRELAQRIAEKIGYDPSKIRFGSYPSGYPFRPLISDQPFLVLDASKIRNDLGGAPQYALSEGLDKTIAYFKAKLAKSA
jgi:nucleoside-diphosphate-sugar epimerase